TGTSTAITSEFFTSVRRRANSPRDVNPTWSRHYSKRRSNILNRQKRSGHTEMMTQFCGGTVACAFCTADSEPIGENCWTRLTPAIARRFSYHKVQHTPWSPCLRGEFVFSSA